MPTVSAESLVLLAGTTVTGVALLWLGRHIRRTEDLSLVAGARGETITDAAGLTTLVGNVTMAVGLATVLVGLLDPLVGSPGRGVLWGAYIVGTLALAGWAHRRSRRFVE